MKEAKAHLGKCLFEKMEVSNKGWGPLNIIYDNNVFYCNFWSFDFIWCVQSNINKIFLVSNLQA